MQTRPHADRRRPGRPVDPAQIDSFEQRAQEFLKREFPAIASRDDPAPLAKFVAHGHRRAVLHGFTGEHDIVQYLAVMMDLGPFFDEDPAREPVMRPFLDASSTMAPGMRPRVLSARRPWRCVRAAGGGRAGGEP